MRPIPIGATGLCVVLAFFAGTTVGSSPGKSTVTNLLQATLSERFTPGREVLVDRVEIPPNTHLDRHWHPGEEFHYYLAGEPEVVIGTAAPVRPALGTVGHVPFETVHRAGAGPAGATILVFRVHTQGQPWRYLEGHPHAGDDAVRQ